MEVCTYFTSLSSLHAKWELTVDLYRRFALFREKCQDDKHRILAVWEVSPPNEENFGRLVLSHAALPIVTEILTSLTLNRMAQALGW